MRKQGLEKSVLFFPPPKFTQLNNGKARVQVELRRQTELDPELTRWTVPTTTGDAWSCQPVPVTNTHAYIKGKKTRLRTADSETAFEQDPWVVPVCIYVWDRLVEETHVSCNIETTPEIYMIISSNVTPINVIKINKYTHLNLQFSLISNPRKKDG